MSSLSLTVSSFSFEHIPLQSRTKHKMVTDVILSPYSYRIFYRALCSSSFSSGLPLVIITPRFILAGSRAQLDMPMKATLSSLAICCKKQNIKFHIQNISLYSIPLGTCRGLLSRESQSSLPLE